LAAIGRSNVCGVTMLSYSVKIDCNLKKESVYISLQAWTSSVGSSDLLCSKTSIDFKVDFIWKNVLGWKDSSDASQVCKEGCQDAGLSRKLFYSRKR
jgi:hypothetical protein